MVSIAVVAIAQAVRERIDLPGGAGALMWNTLQRNPDATWATLASEAIGELADAEIVVSAVEAILDTNTGVELADSALDVLSGPGAAPHVAERDLLAIAERVRGLRLVYRAANLIRSVCASHRVDPDVVTAISAAWARRRDEPSRLSALDLLDLMGRESAKELLVQALADEHAAVRSGAALRVADVYDRAEGLALLDRILGVERKIEVIRDLLHAKSELVMRPNP